MPLYSSLSSRPGRGEPEHDFGETTSFRYKNRCSWFVRPRFGGRLSWRNCSLQIWEEKSGQGQTNSGDAAVKGFLWCHPGLTGWHQRVWVCFHCDSFSMEWELSEVSTILCTRIFVRVSQKFARIRSFSFVVAHAQIATPCSRPWPSQCARCSMSAYTPWQGRGQEVLAGLAQQSRPAGLQGPWARH